MTTMYIYDPEDAPVVGGHAATFGKALRDIGKGSAKATAKRILLREPYEPTGDQAFDIRASAYRDALISGEKQGFEESHEAFMAAGL